MSIDDGILSVKHIDQSDAAYSSFYYPIHPICRTRQSGRSHDLYFAVVSFIGEFTELMTIPRDNVVESVRIHSIYVQ